MGFPKPRGVIFDMDGVLIHSASHHRDAFVEMFQSFGIGDFHYEPYSGWRTAEVVADVLQRKNVPHTPDIVAAAASQKSRLARMRMDADYPLDEDCGIVLAQLGATYRLGLASSGSRNSVEAFLRNSGAGTLFRSVLNGDEVQRAKPDPELYVNCMRRMELKPEECLVVEDAVAGVLAARKAGASVLGLAGTVPAEVLLQAGAERVIEHLRELPSLLPQISQPSRDQWTAIVPAAGKGSRLGYHRPKILYPVADRMILEWMLDFLEPCYGRLIFVLSPEGHEEVAGELNQRIPGRFDVVIQHNPTGMGDAVALALAEVETPHVSVIWGDQVTLQRRSVEICQQLHTGPLRPDLTCPTVLRSNPYIHFERDETGQIRNLRQAREGDEMPERGESDTGFFCFETLRLRELLQQARASHHSAGKRTGEFNLLPVIPLAAQQGTVLTPRVMCIEETMGINSVADVTAVAAFLRRDHASN